ncbi:hypothetical protein R3P38DRAFT_3055809 [Favolaschia claudopus]|uniref:Uncharacterized protein n=1 Tax=Favolaschia claudopus TaxID=2862362 RepID=A0AAW0A4L5_9AGAR
MSSKPTCVALIVVFVLVVTERSATFASLRAPSFAAADNQPVPPSLPPPPPFPPYSHSRHHVPRPTHPPNCTARRSSNSSRSTKLARTHASVAAALSAAPPLSLSTRRTDGGDAQFEVGGHSAANEMLLRR